jgi:phosphoserine phosphatase RsbU/P
VFAITMELIHMGLTLLLAKPFADALTAVEETIIPMTLANAFGVAIFIFIIQNLITERRTAAEKEKYRHELERNEFEMQTAREIQQSFLPESPPDIPGFELAALNIPARQVGGDFYDFIPVSPDKWGIAIADVSGKGVPAALFMALSRTLVRANSHGELTAASTIDKANRLIVEEAKFGMFVTLFYGVLETKRKVLQYINAGHNPPMIFSHNSSNINLLKAKGIALGVIDNADFEQKELALNSGDIVVFYTDGVTEAENDKGEQYGEQRLSRLVVQKTALSAKEISEAIKEEVFAFALNQEQHDDFTLVVLKTTGN